MAIKNRSAVLRQEMLEHLISHSVIGSLFGAIVYTISWSLGCICQYVSGPAHWYANSGPWLSLIFAAAGSPQLLKLAGLRFSDRPVFLDAMFYSRGFMATLALMVSASLLRLLKGIVVPSILDFAKSHPYLLTALVLSSRLLALFAMKIWRQLLSLGFRVVLFLLTLYTFFSALESAAVRFRIALLSILLWPFVLFYHIGQSYHELLAEPDFQSTFRSLPFQYQDLASGQGPTIRLLRSKPRSIYQRLTFDASPIEYELFHVDLNDAPDYEAISYTWGSNIRDHQIVINDRTLDITENAYKVLQQRGDFWFTRTLWIDSVCINQADKVEKSKQVSLMSEIYRKAQRVVAWVGDNAEGGPKAVALVHLLWLFLCFSDNFADMEEWLQWSMYDSHELWNALSTMIRHRWFTRVWVLQEVVLGKHVHVIYGNEYVDWDELVDVLDCFAHEIAMDLLGTHDNLDQLLANPVSHVKAIEYIRHMMRLRWRYQSDELPLTLADAMLASTRGAEDDRDRIFALLSLPKDDQVIQVLRPDYADTTKATTVFVTATKYVITHTDPTRLLPQAGIGYDRKYNDLPSWVPDWSCPPAAKTITYFALTDEENVSLGPHTARYWASGDSHPMPILYSNSNTFSLRGFVVDSIGAVGPAWGQEGTTPLPNISEVLTTIRQYFMDSRSLIERNVPTTYFNGQPRGDAFWRTLVLDRNNEGAPSRPAPDIFATYAEQGMLIHDTDIVILESMLKLIPQFLNGDYSSIAHEMSQLNLLTPDAAQRAERMLNGRKFMHAFSHGRRVCVTAEKRLMGLVPPRTSEGDKVCILFGCQVPYILRPAAEVADRYRLVGECYIHGIMDGEMMPLARDREKAFCLC